jgi:hypothetical protein
MTNLQLLDENDLNFFDERNELEVEEFYYKLWEDDRL